MRKLLPVLFLLVASPAFAKSVVDKAKEAVPGMIGIRATTATVAILNPGDTTTYEVVTPDKLTQYGLTGLKAGAAVTVTVVNDTTVQVTGNGRSIKLAIGANGGVTLVK